MYGISKTYTCHISGKEISQVYSRYRASWQKLPFYWFQCTYCLPRLCTSVYSSLQRRKIIHAEDTDFESFLWNMSGICHIWTNISRSYMEFMFSAFKQSKQSWSWQRASDNAWNRSIWDIWHDTNTHEATFNDQGVVKFILVYTRYMPASVICHQQPGLQL